MLSLAVRAWRVLGSAMAAASLAAPRLAAQDAAPAPPAEQRFVAGRVLRVEPGASRAVPSTWVVLHRVGSDAQGPVDSVRTDAAGRYAFRYQTAGAPDALYFTSATYAGIAYFSMPLRGATVTGDDSEITVFDTTSGPLRLGQRGRHIVVSAAKADGRRMVVEVFELSNDTTLTLVSGAADRPTWSVALPAGARDFRVGQGDIPAGAVRFAAGRALVFSPFAPGIRQLVVSYDLPGDVLPVHLGVRDSTMVLEVLAEDPGALAQGSGLTQKPPVTIEGRSFRRFLAQDVPGNSEVRLTVPRLIAARSRSYMSAAVIATAGIMVVALALAFARRGATAAPRALSGPDESARLAREIADLDAAFEREPPQTEAARDGYRRERAALKARLQALLDPETVAR